MKAVLTVMGIDKTGIIAKTSSLLYENDINILDINQTIMQYFHHGNARRCKLNQIRFRRTV